MAITIKHTVRPRTLCILAAIATCAEEAGVSILVLSANDGGHLCESRHYSDEALDFDVCIDLKLPQPQRGQQIAKRTDFLERLKLRLGPRYKVVMEDDYYHAEFVK